jgi:hypothetical protein
LHRSGVKIGVKPAFSSDQKPYQRRQGHDCPNAPAQERIEQVPVGLIAAQDAHHDPRWWSNPQPPSGCSSDFMVRYAGLGTGL